jgi:hypothetical protein
MVSCALIAGGVVVTLAGVLWKRLSPAPVVNENGKTEGG